MRQRSVLGLAVVTANRSLVVHGRYDIPPVSAISGFSAALGH